MTTIEKLIEAAREAARLDSFNPVYLELLILPDGVLIRGGRARDLLSYEFSVSWSQVELSDVALIEAVRQARESLKIVRAAEEEAEAITAVPDPRRP